MNESLIYSGISLIYALLHLTALIVSLVFWRRLPKVCVLVFIGSLLNLAAMGARIALPTFWFQIADDRVPFALANAGISLVSVAGLGLYLLAVFTGRESESPHRLRPLRLEDDWDRTMDMRTKPERGSSDIRE